MVVFQDVLTKLTSVLVKGASAYLELRLHMASGSFDAVDQFLFRCLRIVPLNIDAVAQR